MENPSDSLNRKLQFTVCRTSFQPYVVQLKEGIYDPKEAYCHVVISKRADNGQLEPVCRLRVDMDPPPRPPTPPPPIVIRPQNLVMEKPRPKSANPFSSRRRRFRRTSVTSVESRSSNKSTEEKIKDFTRYKPGNCTNIFMRHMFTKSGKESIPRPNPSVNHANLKLA